MSFESKYKSPFSVDHRRPIFIKNNDHRAQNNIINNYKSRVGSKIYNIDQNSKLKNLSIGVISTENLSCSAPTVTYEENTTTDDWSWTTPTPNFGTVVGYQYQLSFDGTEENVVLDDQTTNTYLSLPSTGGCSLRVRAKCVYNSIFYGDWSNFI
jgi:hypothetical protein